MWESFDILLGILALGYGILLLTGNIGTFRDNAKYKNYDIKKLERTFGIASLVLGALSFLNWKFPSKATSVIGIILVLGIVAFLAFYMKKCKK